eukprot:404781_1
MAKWYFSFLTWISIIHTSNSYSIHRSNKHSPSNGYSYSVYKRQQDYDIYDMINEQDHQQYSVHKYPPYYWSKHVFPALFGYSDMIDDDTLDDSDSSEENSQYSDRRQIVAFLLSCFLGAFGDGRFYVGE